MTVKSLVLTSSLMDTANLDNLSISSITLNGSTSGSLKLVVPAAAGSATYTLPSADGSYGQALVTNGSGTLSWSTAGSAAKSFLLMGA